MEEEKQIKTVDGSLALRSECRYIKGAFYKIGDSTIEDSGQCYLVDGKYCRADIGYIVYDNGLSKYVRKTDNLIEGIIDLATDLETPLYGYFSPNEIYNVKVYLKDSTMKTVLEESILDNSYYKERLMDGNFYHISLLKAKDFQYKTVNREDKRSLPYDSKGNMEANIRIYNDYNNSKPSPFIEKNYKKLKDLTFGFEFETTNGFIPNRITSRLGLLPLRDGSISGLEYVTIPLSGKKGLQTLVDVSKELQKRTEYDETCSMHLHIGNIPRTMEFINALYRVLINLEDEIYKCFPPYKRYSYGIKRKEYTKPLPVLNILPYMDDKINKDNIIDNFDVLYRYFSMGQGFKGNFTSLNDVESHPSDPHGSSKWNISSRYSMHNIIPLIFGNKQTIEFRVHNATDEADKMINFLFMNAAIINFTKKYEDKILGSYKFVQNINLEYILTNMYPEGDLGYDLAYYFSNRKANIRNNVQKGDMICSEKTMSSSSIRWGNTSDKEGKLHYSYIKSSLIRRSSPVTTNEAERVLEEFRSRGIEIRISTRASLTNTIEEPLTLDED